MVPKMFELLRVDCISPGNSQSVALRTAPPGIARSTPRSVIYSWLWLSRLHLSRITDYLEVEIWFLLKHGNLTSDKVLWKKQTSPLCHNIFKIYLISVVKLHIRLLNVVVCFIFSWILQIWYVELRIARSISDSPLNFAITRVDCTFGEEWSWNHFYSLLLPLVLEERLTVIGKHHENIPI